MILDFGSITAYIIGLVFLFLLGWLFIKPLKWLIRLVLNSLLGGSLLNSQVFNRDFPCPRLLVFHIIYYTLFHA